METIVLIVHVLIALAIIGLIMLQQGKGADAGASFGGGASQTVFGASGSGNVLSHGTAILSTLFFVTSLSLAWLATNKAEVSVDDGIPSAEVIEAAETEVPVVDDEAGIPTVDEDPR